MFLLRYTPLLPFSTRMRIRDQCIYITRLGVGPHINVLQRDLSILSCPSPEQDSRLNIHSPSSPFFLFYSPFVRCIANMAAKLLSLYLLAIACLVVVRAGPLVLEKRQDESDPNGSLLPISTDTPDSPNTATIIGPTSTDTPDFPNTATIIGPTSTDTPDFPDTTTIIGPTPG